MRKIHFLFLLLALTLSANATIYYASPTGSGTGTIGSPFSLTTALSASSGIAPGDTLYLRSGTYAGRFVSYLAGTTSLPITVMSYPNEWAVLSGNISPAVNTTDTAALTVTGDNVIYRDFEIKYNGLSIRLETDPGFVRCEGITHPSGINCKFINLRIHDNPGVGMWSSRGSAPVEVYGCLIYNNGWYSDGTAGTVNRGRGPGLYCQNETDEYKTFRNNIVFNNFYNGFEVWSASVDQPPIVKNMVLDNNTSFNNGSPYATSTLDKGANDILVATENNQLYANYPTNISVINNDLYHNTDFTDANGLNGEARPLKIGHPDSETHDVVVDNNFMCGRNPGVEINTSYNLTFTNNTVLNKYVYMGKKLLDLNLVNTSNFYFDNNKYYTRFNYNGFRFPNPDGSNTEYSLVSWKSTFGLDLNSSQYSFRLDLNTPSVNPVVSKVTRNEYNPFLYKVVLFKYSNPSSPNVTVDFSSYGIPSGTTYTIKDVENYPAVNFSGTYTGTPITFNLNYTTPAFIAPIGTYPQANGTSYRTPDNFGVFLIEFTPYHSADNKVYTTNLQSDGKVIFGGDFSKYNGSTANRIARLDTAMKLDGAFSTNVGTGPNDRVNASLIHTGGKIVLAGKFTSCNGTARNRITRLLTTGANDSTFSIGTGANGEILALAQLPDGSIFIGGTFTTYNGVSRINIAKLTSTGALDTSFTSGFAVSDFVNTIEVQSDGKILVGGIFASYSGNTVSNIVRLTSTGAFDSTFATGLGFDDSVSCIKQSGTNILVGGDFRNFNGTARRCLARLTSTGALDTTFVPFAITVFGGGSGVKSIQVQADGNIMIAGGFAERIARVTSLGALDTTFDPNPGFGPHDGRGSLGSWVKSMSIQTDGKVVCGGFFTSYNNNPVSNITRITPTGAGTIARQAADPGEKEVAVNDDVDGVYVYPNPFSTYITVDLKNLNANAIKIFSSTGELVKSQKIGKEDRIDLEFLRKGIYFYKIYNGDLLLKSGSLVK